MINSRGRPLGRVLLLLTFGACGRSEPRGLDAASAPSVDALVARDAGGATDAAPPKDAPPLQDGRSSSDGGWVVDASRLDARPPPRCEPASVPEPPDALSMDPGIVLTRAAVSSPFIAVAPQGVRVVWLERSGIASTLRHAWIAGGIPGPLEMLELPAQTIQPAFVAEADGSVALAWVDATADELHLTRLPADQAPAVTVPIATGGGEPRGPRVARRPGGGLTVIWYEIDPGRYRLLETRVEGTTAGGPADTGLNLNRERGSLRLDLAADSTGALHLVYEDIVAGSPYPDSPDLFYATRPSGGAWSAATNLTLSPLHAHHSSEPRLAVDAADRIHLVWVEQNHDATDPEAILNFEVHYRVRPPGATFGAAVDLSREGLRNNVLSPERPRIQIDCRGEPRFAWSSRPPERPPGSALLRYTPAPSAPAATWVAAAMGHEVAWAIDPGGAHHLTWVTTLGELRYQRLGE